MAGMFITQRQYSELVDAKDLTECLLLAAKEVVCEEPFTGGIAVMAKLIYDKLVEVGCEDVGAPPGVDLSAFKDLTRADLLEAQAEQEKIRDAAQNDLLIINHLLFG